MHHSNNLKLIVVLGLIAYSSGYLINAVYSGADFINSSFWRWEGPVDYEGGNAILVDYKTPGIFNVQKLAENYYASTFTSIPKPGDANHRYSYRLRGQRVIKPNTLIMVELSRMPESCGAWPGIWLYSPDNDNITKGQDPFMHGGEVDIVEGVNGLGNNNASLHTKPGCQFSNQPTNFDGYWSSRDCNHNINGNMGCVNTANNGNSFGRDFNLNGGGWFAIELTQDAKTPSTGAIKMWYIPASAKYQWQYNPNPANFPAAASKFSEFDMSADHCDATWFSKLVLIIDLTICGNFVDALWESSGCGALAKTCNDYLLSQNNNINLKSMQFVINSVNIYQ